MAQGGLMKSLTLITHGRLNGLPLFSIFMFLLIPLLPFLLLLIFNNNSNGNSTAVAVVQELVIVLVVVAAEKRISGYSCSNYNSRPSSYGDDDHYNFRKTLHSRPYLSVKNSLLLRFA